MADRLNVPVRQKTTAAHLARLVGDERAHMAFLDPPYNVAVRTIVGRGKKKHPEFAMASGEMSRDDFIAFLKATLNAAAKVSSDGAVHFVCMDWRHVEELVVAGRDIYGAMLNLITWVKTNAGHFRVGDVLGRIVCPVLKIQVQEIDLGWFKPGDADLDPFLDQKFR